MTKYAVITRAVYGPDGRSKAEEMASRLDGIYRSQPGYERAEYLSFDDTTGEFGSLVLFDTKAHAESAFQASQRVREQTTRDLGIVRRGTPERRIVEVLSVGHQA
jgi:heme-degrading monooxygenase HmoA